MDNASSDGSVAYTAARFPEVKIIAHTQNLGFAEGYNRAINSVHEELVAIINSDTAAEPHWLSGLARALSEKRAHIAGSKICFMENPRKINSAGKKLTYSGIGTDIGYGLEDTPGFDQPRETAALCGAAMIFPRAVFLSLGGFDKDFFILCEDTDLCWRAWLAGYTVTYEPASRVLHRFGQAIGKRETPVRVFYSHRNAILIVIKNFGCWRLFLCGCVIAAYSALKAFLFLITAQWKNLGALLAGTASACKMIPATIRKRAYIQSGRKISDKELERKGFIASLPESVREYLRVSALKNI